MSSAISNETVVNKQTNDDIKLTSAENATTQVSRKRHIEDDENDTRPTKYHIIENNKDNSNDINVELQLSATAETTDKPESEKIVNHSILVANHYNLLEEKGLAHRYQSRIIYMRNFNNWIKSMLINEYMQKLKEDKRGVRLKVMDMCCGKGGDLLKWSRANVRHVICADIAEVSINQCKSRYEDISTKDQRRRNADPVFSAQFIVADCTKFRLRKKFEDPSIQLDLVSCQFALHYSFESLPQAEMMLKNASETLKAGGYFIGTIPDAYDLVSRWQKSETNKFGNEVYNVEFQCESKEKPPLFGAKYNFHLEGVVDCPEFLVYLPLFKKLALKFGLNLVLFERFEDFYARMKDQGKFLLNKMEAFETYFENPDTPLVSKNPQDYEHAKQYLHKNTRSQRIGTLSKSEWEATSLYAVFAFQKMKSSLDAEGKPVYSENA